MVSQAGRGGGKKMEGNRYVYYRKKEEEEEEVGEGGLFTHSTLIILR